jgi:hypothetical protein
MFDLELWKVILTILFQSSTPKLRWVLSLKFRPHMATRTQHRQTVMKSFMALN